MEPRETPEALLRLAARALYRYTVRPPLENWEPGEYWSTAAGRLLQSLEFEGLEVRPKALDEDINASEEGT